MAIGILIGAAFGTVVNALVKDVLMPPIGLLTAGTDFSELYINPSDQEYASPACGLPANEVSIRTSCGRRRGETKRQ